MADDATRRELAFLSEGRSFDGEPCPRAKIDDKRIKSLCATMYRIARKNCDTEEECRTVKRITPQQLEAWGVITKVHGKWMGSNTYALLMGDPAFAIRLKCGLFKGNDMADCRAVRRLIALWPVTQRFAMTFSPRPSTTCAISRNGAVGFAA